MDSSNQNKLNDLDISKIESKKNGLDIDLNKTIEMINNINFEEKFTELNNSIINSKFYSKNNKIEKELDFKKRLNLNKSNKQKLEIKKEYINKSNKNEKLKENLDSDEIKIKWIDFLDNNFFNNWMRLILSIILNFFHIWIFIHQKLKFLINSIFCYLFQINNDNKNIKIKINNKKYLYLNEKKINTIINVFSIFLIYLIFKLLIN